MIHLVVIHDFADFKRGDHITDPAAVEQYPKALSSRDIAAKKKALQVLREETRVRETRLALFEAIILCLRLLIHPHSFSLLLLLS